MIALEQRNPAAVAALLERRHLLGVQRRGQFGALGLELGYQQRDRQPVALGQLATALADLPGLLGRMQPPELAGRLAQRVPLLTAQSTRNEWSIDHKMLTAAVRRLLVGREGVGERQDRHAAGFTIQVPPPM